MSGKLAQYTLCLNTTGSVVSTDFIHELKFHIALFTQFDQIQKWNVRDERMGTCPADIVKLKIVSCY